VIQAGLDIGEEELNNGDSSEVIGFVASTIPEVSMLVELACQKQCRPFNDILLGVPICQSKLFAISALKNKLRSKFKCVDTGTIHILIDHPAQVHFLHDFIQNEASSYEGGSWSVFMKLDTGYHRAGTTCDKRGVDLATEIINSPVLELKGVYSHCGHAYNIDDEEEMNQTAEMDLSLITSFLEKLGDHLKHNNISFDTSSLHISVGSTPSLFSHKHHSDMINPMEIHPGNYVFFDRQQLWTGACKHEQYVASFVLARVIGHYPDIVRNAIMVDAGATALTKESTPQGEMCSVFGHPDLECYRMSQEVTMIRRRKEFTDKSGGGHFPFEQFPLGSTLLLVPNHSCLAAACFDKYYVVDENCYPFGRDAAVVDEWKPVTGWL